MYEYGRRFFSPTPGIPVLSFSSCVYTERFFFFLTYRLSKSYRVDSPGGRVGKRPRNGRCAAPAHVRLYTRVGLDGPWSFFWTAVATHRTDRSPSCHADKTLLIDRSREVTFLPRPPFSLDATCFRPCCWPSPHVVPPSLPSPCCRAVFSACFALGLYHTSVRHVYVCACG